MKTHRPTSSTANLKRFAIQCLLPAAFMLASESLALPVVSVETTDAQASENGNNSGIFTLIREGDLQDELVVGLSLGGSAINGLDYSFVPPSITLPPGIDAATVTISPFADSQVELDEIVVLILQPSSGYVLSANNYAQLFIKDLQPVVEIQTLEPLGSKDPSVPATALVKRNGRPASSLFVRLSIGGNARNGVDYSYVSSYVNFAPGQTTVPINVLPMAGGTLDGGAETVLVAIIEDPQYALADTHSARLILTERRDYLELWQTREFPGSTDSPAAFAGGDEGNLGIGNLARFAYGLDPHAPDVTLFPQLVIRDGRCQIDVHRNPGAMDVEFEASVSTDLVDWNSATIQKIVVPEHEENAHIETYVTDTPVGSSAKQFIRVRLIYNP